MAQQKKSAFQQNKELRAIFIRLRECMKELVPYEIEGIQDHIDQITRTIHIYDQLLDLEPKEKKHLKN